MHRGDCGKVESRAVLHVKLPCEQSQCGSSSHRKKSCKHVHLDAVYDNEVRDGDDSGFTVARQRRDARNPHELIDNSKHDLNRSDTPIAPNQQPHMQLVDAILKRSAAAGKACSAPSPPPPHLSFCNRKVVYIYE